MFRRLFVGLVALVLAMSVLTVSPAGAANTASEGLSDHDNNAATAQIRAFGGSNRYATSVALAEAFVAGGGSGGFVESVIVASGESLIDAAAAAGLAASESAPVLLTPPSRLSRTVENFIVDEFISEVFIVGGTSVIPQSVEDAIAALAPVRTVTRVAGADRYGTAVAVANEIGSPGVYCDSGLVTALLVNVDSSFADVIAVGPLAYALGLPILLTRAGELPANVAGYLADAEIERVVVIGGTTAVSAAVVADVNEAGVDDVVRISGANRYDTALEIRQALSDCSTVTLSPDTVALVNGAAAADGVSAGPLLGVGLDNNGVTPVLLVDSDGLPSDTREYLSGLPTRSADASFVDLSITAIGGSAVVPDTVVQAAIAAATTSSPITATVAARVGSDTITVVFSAPVNGVTSGVAGFTTSALNRAHYRVSGGPLLLGDSLALSNGNRTLTITMADDSKLVEGTAISVADGTIKGQGADNRRVVGAQVAVRALPADRVRPNIDIFAPEDSHAIRISVTEPNLATSVASAADRNALLARIQVDGVALYVANAAAGRNDAAVLPSSSSTDVTVCLFGLDDADAAVCEDTAPTGDDALVAALAAVLATGETVTVAAGAFVDDRGNESRSTSQRVTAFASYPRVTRATVTSPVTLDIGTAAAPDNQVALWRWQRYDSASPPVVDENILTIAARPDGAAGGATGNGWRVIWIGPPADEDQDPDTVAEVSVSVNKARKTVLINFDEDATIFSVVTALAADSAFAELFTVNSDVFADNDLANEKLVADAGDTNNDNLVEVAADTTLCTAAPVAGAQCGQPNTATPWTLSGGVSVVVVTLSYSETLRSFDYASLVAANQAAAKFPSAQRTVATGTRAQQLVGWQTDPFGAALDLDDEFSFLLTTSSATFADLPKSGDTISLPAALGTTFAPSDCSDGLTQNSDNDPCGRSIAVTTPGQTLRRDSISGRVEGAETTVVETFAITATIRATEHLVTVVFSAPVDRATAELLSSYQIDNSPLPADTTVELSADRRMVTITFPVDNDLEDGETFTIVDGAIRAADTNDDDITVDTTEIAVIVPVPPGPTVVVPPQPTPITAKIEAIENELTFTVTFSARVNGAADGETDFAGSARNRENYQIDPDGSGANPAAVLPAGTVIDPLTGGDTVATITLPAGSTLLAAITAEVIVRDGRIAAADGGGVTVDTASLQVQIPVINITAELGARTITVDFRNRVNITAPSNANFSASARNPAHYRLTAPGVGQTPAALPAGTTIEDTGGTGGSAGQQVTIMLPLGSELTAGTIVTVLGGVIRAESGNRTVGTATFSVVDAITVEVTGGYTGENSFMVTFSAPVNSAASTDVTNFPTSARNPANYFANSDAAFGTVTYDAATRTATIQVATGQLLGSMFGVPTSNNIAAADANDARPVASKLLSVTNRPAISASLGETVAGTRQFQIVFDPAVNGDASTDANFATSARNPANYRVGDMVLPGTLNIGALTANAAGDIGTVVTINVPEDFPGLDANFGGVLNRTKITVLGSQIAGVVDASARAADVDLTTDPILEARLTTAVGSNTLVADFFPTANEESIPAQSAFSTSARNRQNYTLNGVPLTGSETIAVAPQIGFKRFIIPLAAAAKEGDVFAISESVDNRISSGDSNDERLALGRPFTVPPAIPASISADIGTRVITVTFGAEVTVAGPALTVSYGSSAINPANYRLNNNPLPASTTFTHQDTTAPDGTPITEVTITLPNSANALVAGNVILIPANTISRRGMVEDGQLRVEETDLTVAASTTPITVTTILAIAGERTITITFSARVNGDADGEAGFTNSARNPANYRLRGAALPAGTTIAALESDNTVALITLPDSAPVLAENDQINIVAGQITAQFDPRMVQPLNPAFTVVGTLTAEFTRVASGRRFIRLRFSAPVNGAADGEAGFDGSARNPANYELGDAALPAGTTIAALESGPNGANTMAVIRVPNGVPGNVNAEVLPNRIESADGDGRLVLAASGPSGPLFDITATIMAQAGSSTVYEVAFDDLVHVAVLPNNPTTEQTANFEISALNPANYELGGANLTPAHLAKPIEVFRGGTAVRITLLVSPNPAANFFVIKGRIEAPGEDDARRVLQSLDFMPPARLPLTATVSAIAGERTATITFNESVNGVADGEAGFGNVSALFPGNYRIDFDGDGTTFVSRAPNHDEVNAVITLSDNGLVATITLPAGEAIPVGARISLIGNRVKAVTNGDTRVVGVDMMFFVFDVPEPALEITVTEVDAVSGSRTITVTFDTAVNGAAETEAGFDGSARNPANYQVNGVALIDSLVAPLTANDAGDADTVATISLPFGAGLEGGDEISIVGGSIRGSVDSTRLVTAFDFTVPTPPPLVATISAVADTRTITVNFDALVNRVGESNLNFRRSSINPANYQVKGVTLNGDNSSFVYSEPTSATSRVVITLNGPASLLAAGDVISIIGVGDNRIIGQGADRRLVAATDFTVPVPPAPLTATITAYTGCNIITIRFSEAPNSAEAAQSGFATSTRNPRNYVRNGGDADGLLTNPGDGQYDLNYEPTTTTTTIRLFDFVTDSDGNTSTIALGHARLDFFLFLGNSISSAADSSRFFPQVNAPRPAQPPPPDLPAENCTFVPSTS